MKKFSIHKNNNDDIKRFNPSIEEGLNDESINYMKSVGKANIVKNPLHFNVVVI